MDLNTLMRVKFKEGMSIPFYLIPDGPPNRYGYYTLTLDEVMNGHAHADEWMFEKMHQAREVPSRANTTLAKGPVLRLKLTREVSMHLDIQAEGGITRADTLYHLITLAQDSGRVLKTLNAKRTGRTYHHDVTDYDLRLYIHETVICEGLKVSDLIHIGYDILSEETCSH